MPAWYQAVRAIVVAALALTGGPGLMAWMCARGGAGSRRLMVEARFDELIHPSTRLSVVAILASTVWADFSFVRDRLGLSDSALSKQFATLEDAGYMTVERPVSNRRRRVRVRLTAAGRAAFAGHVAALQELFGDLVLIFSMG